MDTERIIQFLKDRTSIKFLQLEARALATGPFDSKFIGIPYLPPGFEYPRSKSSKQPLFLLAQINFEELPQLNDFPETGILQFYINANDDQLGCNLQNELDQSEFRIIYHETIINDENLLQKPPEGADGNYFFGNDASDLHLFAVLKDTFMSQYDYRFENSLKEEIKQAIPEIDIDKLYDVMDQIADVENPETHRIGGYPFFTQDDPRHYQKSIQGHTVLLLQICSRDGIMWGDAGVGNFFITPEDLKSRNFSRVAYHWDCG
ncbi:MAG: hypothetical protein EZS28_021465 [Streblomastix strix]|uniref:DUF1963 domain-containing protein n=1 Tax=Streblomastix strix TaxID=222440 RepID=A0A5J4VK83_9EUKA|nr:MAG: hypothetical protein EZS28_021465 [Streblomastix strix]